jgi:hypothetical protein
MPVQEMKKAEIAINFFDSSQIFEGYVQLDLHESDGSRTILIRTEPSESVKNFLANEIVTNTKNNDFCPACDIYSDCNYCADCGREIQTS